MVQNCVLEFKNVSSNQLSPFSLKIFEKEILTVIGPSGAGKSSFLSLCNRLEDPLDGVIDFHGQEIKNIPIPYLRRRIGMVFQSPHLFSGTVLENIKYGPSLINCWDENSAYSLMEIVNLPKELLNRDIEVLSGGEKQRVAIARTLANDPEIILLDEPTSALDLRTTEIIEEVFLYLCEEKKMTLIMVTHNLEQAKRMGDRTMFITNGTIKKIEETSKLFNHPGSEELNQFLYGDGDRTNSSHMEKERT